MLADVTVSASCPPTQPMAQAVEIAATCDCWSPTAGNGPHIAQKAERRRAHEDAGVLVWLGRLESASAARWRMPSRQSELSELTQRSKSAFPPPDRCAEQSAELKGPRTPLVATPDSLEVVPEVRSEVIASPWAFRVSE